MTRRRFLQLCIGAGAFLAAGEETYRLFRERYYLAVTRRTMPVPALPQALAGMRVAVLSDFHAGPYTPWWLVRRAILLAMAHNPDMLLLLGDFVSTEAGASRRPLQQALADLRAPFGVWAVLGNHEYFYGRREPVIEALHSAGIRVLLNEAAPVTLRGETIYIVGLEDPVTGHHDFDKATGSIDLNAHTWLLAHTPDVIYAASDLHFNALFAAHTHGGQICLPLYGPLLVPSKYGRRFAAGLFHVRNTAMFVTRGVGVVPPLYRFHCPPEVAILTLQPA